MKKIANYFIIFRSLIFIPLSFSLLFAQNLSFDGTNDYGDPVGAGVYLYQLQAKDFVETRKMVLLK